MNFILSKEWKALFNCVTYIVYRSLLSNSLYHLELNSFSQKEKQGKESLLCKFLLTHFHSTNIMAKHSHAVYRPVAVICYLLILRHGYVLSNSLFNSLNFSSAQPTASAIAGPGTERS